MSYYISKSIKEVFVNVKNAVIKALQDEGFGVLTVIDIQEKPYIKFRKYKILGACNPPHAYKALKIEDKIGTMLPYNVILHEIEKDVIEIAAINPLKPIELAIKEKLLNALNALEKEIHLISISNKLRHRCQIALVTDIKRQSIKMKCY